MCVYVYMKLRQVCLASTYSNMHDLVLFLNMYALVRMHVCTKEVSMCVCVWMYYTWHTHVCARIYVCAYMHVHTRRYVYVYACMRYGTCTWVRASIGKCVNVFIYVCCVCLVCMHLHFQQRLVTSNLYISVCQNRAKLSKWCIFTAILCSLPQSPNVLWK